MPASDAPGNSLRSKERRERLYAQMQNRLYVGKLAGDVSASALQELFEPYGFVTDVKLVPGGKDDRTLGFAFVIMATDEAALAAMRGLDGASLHEVAIRVEVAQEEAKCGWR